MGTFLNPGDATDKMHQAEDAQLVDLKLTLQGFASRALEITPRRLRNQSHKTWLELGGDSLTAVNFMGLCHDAGIDVDIPDVFLSASLDELLGRIAQSHHEKHGSAKDEDPDVEGNGDCNGDAHCFGLLENDDPLSDVLRRYGPLHEVQAIGPCSPMQENFMALQQIDPQAYQLRLTARLGSTDPAVVMAPKTVGQAWEAVVRRHVALRTMFVESVDRPGRFDQIVWKNARPQISVLSLAEVDTGDNKERESGYESEFPHHLILAQEPENKVLVKLFISHAIADGVSIEILFRDLFNALREPGSLSAHEEATIKAEDFIHAQQPDTSQDAFSYWSRYVSGAEGTFLSSPSTKERPTGLYSIDQDVLLRPDLVQALSRESKATMVNACQVAYALVLRCYTGTSNISFSYTTAGRQKRVRGLRHAVGAFLNTLPCRLDLADTPTITEALSRTQRDFLDSLPYQGADLTDKHGLGGKSLRELGDSLLSFYGGLPEAELLADAGLTVDIESWDAPSDVCDEIPRTCLSCWRLTRCVQYNHTLMIGIGQHKLQLRFTAWKSLISRDDAHNMMQLFQKGLEFVLQNTSQPCSDFVGSLTRQDEAKILATNRIPLKLINNCVHEQVWAMTQRQPDAPAICAWDGELTYSELEAKARRLAAHLVELGAGLEVKVGLCMDKSRWGPVAMLAILQAGAAVVPLGTQHPLNRTQTIARNADMTLLLADKVHAERLEGIVARTVVVDEVFLNSLPPPPGTTALSWPRATPDNAGWVVYTSGSTGVPKGVVLQHKALCTPMHAQAARYGMGPGTRALNFSALTFDITVKDFFTTLSFGGCVCVPSETQRLNDLEGAVREFGVNFATLTPTVASLLDPRRVPTLRTIVGTGEALKQAVVQPWLEEGRVKWYNAYGPSECSHTSTINGPITHAKDASNIGFPALNCLWVTDPLDFNGLSPIGAVGELLIEGPIAREYLHDPAKTAASFVVDPYFVKRLGLAPGRRMYRTGDLVRQNKDGSLTYLGRRDTQIKIRGQRVEVREIESCISQSLPGNPTVCVELVRPQGGSDSVSPAGMLVAAIDMHHEPAAQGGPAPGTLCEPSESLRDQLQSLHSKLVDELPLYMVPSYLVPFGVLPTNASGKQDRQATRAILEKLTDSELGMFQQANGGKGNIFTETERSLQAIWAEALGRPAASIGSNDHFVQAGGDSVVAMRMVTIARKHNVSLSVADITSHPRLADMARVVDGYHHKLENAAAKDSKPFELWKRFQLATAEEKQRRLASVANQCKISPDEVVDVYPASPLQEGLMAMTSQEPGTYVAQQVFEMSRKIDVERLQKALAAVAASLAILRTRIVYTPDSGSVQIVARYAPPCRTATTSDLTMFLERDRTASFAYGTPLHRFSIVNDDSSTQTSPEGEQRGRYFIWTAHHSGYDGETISKTLRMLAQVYQEGSCDTVPPITRFVRYLTQQIGEESEGWERTKAYWKQELEGAQLTRFPEAPSPTYRPFADGFLRHRFAQLGGQGTIGRVSLAILLRAAWALVVSSRTGSAEAMLAVVLSGRDAPVFGIESVVAPTITTVPVRVQIHRGKTVGEFLSDADTQNKNMVPYTQFGLANIRREVPDLGNDFDPGHLFAVHVGDTAEEDLAAVRALGLERMAGERQNFEGYALVVECMLETSSNSGSTSIEVEVHFDKNVISPGQVVALVSQLGHVMAQLEPHNRPDASLTVAQREATVGDLDLIAPDEKEKLLAWNRPPPAPVQTTLYELFQKQSRQTPHSQAICARGRNFTYSQLDEAAGRLAQHLIASGVGPEILVGVCMDKSEFAIVSMLAISRAGGAVVPLGIQFSDSRLQGLIADAGISIALVDSAQAKRFGRLVPRHIVVNSSLLASLNPLTQELIPRASPQNVAWVIFTSGSTGMPKGVVLEHQALCSGVLANGVRYGVTPSTRTFAFSAFTFDVSITDLWTTLAYGGCVCVPSEQDRTDNVVGAMNDFAITFAVLTPTVTSLLDPDSVPASLDTIVFVGEAIKPAAVEPWLGLVEKLFNGYGPAECSIYSVINGPILRAEDAPIIGSNVSNRLWVTDTRDHNSLVPIGAPGELLIEGPALARSYLHDPAKTAKSFVVDPKFVASLQLPPGRRMYRTGDLVRQNPEDGSLVCLGRIDTQVKIRGQRVEVGEIESNIVRLRPEIQHACVDLVKLQGASDPMLLAAVEIQDIKNVNGDANGADLSNVIARPLPHLTITLGGLRAELAQILPLYMVPARIVPMKFPVNASGKLDRRATREMLEQLTREQLRELADEPTRNGTIEDRMLSEMEEQLRLLWAQVLGIPVEEIRSAEDDFFQLGGDSVSAMRLVAAAQAAPKPMRLGVLQILKNPTLVDMARVASKHSAATADPTKAPDPAPFELWDGFNDATPEEQQKRLEALAAQCQGVASPDEIVDVYPSTSLQEGLMAITSKQTSAYVAQQVFRLGTGVDVSRLQHCWDVLSSKLAILRTRIVYTAQGSVQVVVKEAPGWEFASDLSSYLAKDQSQIFAYGTPLHRQAIVHDPETDQKYFVWTLHHAAYDGWSLLLVLRMFVRIYQEGEAGLASFAETPISRFIKYLKDTDDDAMTAYWRNQLEGAQLTRFPPLPSSAYQPHAASLVQTRLHGLSEKHRSESTNSAGGTAASLGTLLQATWAVTVATYTGSDEALLNVALSGRDAPVQDIANVVGPTLTTVPVRVKINKEQPVASLLAAVAQQAKEMGPFAHAGLHRIRNAVPGLGSNFDAGHLFIIQPALTDSDSPGLEVIGLEQDNTAVADSTESRDFGGYALAVDCTVDAGSVHVEIRYDNNVLSHPSAAALLSHFEYTIRQLEACATGPDSNKRVADLDLFSPADAHMVRKWNQNTPPAKQACIHELIQQAAARTPNSLAVKAWDGEFSYTSLDTAARRLARHLVSRYGIGPEVTVGLCMDKSCWAVVSMLAILVAGGVVVPLGVQQPLARIEIIVKDSALSTILVDVTQAARLGQLKGGKVPPCVVVDSGLLGQLPPVSGTSTGDASIPVCDKVSPDNAAWIVYTSGSTGVPKGVVLEHKALCSSFEAHGPRVGFGPDTRALQFSSYTFDNCIEDILSVLSVGGCVCVPSEDQRMNSLTETIRDMNINLLNTTPTVASLIQPADVPSLKTL
jgi:amino acid adenylation domain-containing protein